MNEPEIQTDAVRMVRQDAIFRIHARKMEATGANGWTPSVVVFIDYKTPSAGDAASVARLIADLADYWICERPIVTKTWAPVRQGATEEWDWENA